MRERTRVRTRFSREAGMSMIELMIAMVVLAIGLGALSSLFVLASATDNKNSRATSSALLAGFKDPAPYLYFVHSFAVPIGAWTVAVTDYGGEFSSVVQHRNFQGVQFHPERSSRAGARLLANFLGRDVACA